MKKVRYYSSFNDDFEHTANQDFALAEDYKWIEKSRAFKLLSATVYSVALVVGSIYCRFILHMKIKGNKNLKSLKEGCFIYGNHTQPFGDVFIPALCAFPKRIYTVVSTANYGIPVIGKLLPYLGAMPIVESIGGLKELSKAIDYRCKNGNPVVIYPEAHVWRYYTDIRPFAETSFKFPVKYEKPVFSMTSVYRKNKIFKRPSMTVYIDGPFYPVGNSIKEKTVNLKNTVYTAMVQRSKNSNCEYIEYKPKN